MSTRKSKIARLPLDVREELNRRLENGEPGTDLVTWLNGHPKVKEVMAAYFGGREITEQNLSEWRKGGYQDWLAREEEAGEAEAFAEAAEKLAESTNGRLTDHLSTVLAMRYATLVARWKGEVTPEFRRKLEVLRALRKDVVALRRSEHDDIRVTMAQQRFEWDVERYDREAVRADEEELEHEFAKKAEYRRKLRHIKWLAEMDEKYSKPPPPEERQKEEGRRMKDGNIEQPSGEVSSASGTGGASRTGEEAESGKQKAETGGSAAGIEHPTGGEMEEQNSKVIQGNPTKSNLLQGKNEMGKAEEVEALESLGVNELKEEDGMQNAEKREPGSEPAAEAKAENEDTKQHLVEEMKPKETAEGGNAAQMSDVEAYVLAEKKKVRVDAIVTSRRWSRHWRGLEG